MRKTKSTAGCGKQAVDKLGGVGVVSAGNDWQTQQVWEWVCTDWGFQVCAKSK